MKRIISVLLAVAMVMTAVMSLAGCSSGPAKIKVTDHSLDLIDGASLSWEQVKTADYYKIYRGELGEETADQEVECIEASDRKTYSYKSGIFGEDNPDGFGYGRHDAYQIKAFSVEDGEEKLIAQSDVYRLYNEFGENGAIMNYLDYAKKAVGTTQSAFKTLGVSKMGSFGKTLDKFLGNLSKGIGLTQTVMKFLGLGGSNEPTLDEKMYAEIQEMHQEITEISGKLDTVNAAVHKVSQNLSQFRAETEFRNLSDRSEALYGEWRSFEQNYMETGMDDLLDRYNWLIRDGIEEWCRNQTSAARKPYGIDNTQIIVVIDPETDEPILFRENRVPSEAESYPYIILKKACLPESMENWTIDSYNNLLAGEISNNLVSALDSGDEEKIASVIDSGNFKEVTAEGWAALDETRKAELIDRICAFANEALLYRISVAKINEDSSFVREVIVTFKNYCTNLTGKRGTGIDAFLQSMYLTACFEGEIKDDYRTFCTNMMAQTCEYAVFALEIVGKSDKTSKNIDDTASDANVVGAKWSQTIEVIDAALQNGLTGYDDFCFLVGARVDAVPVSAYVCYTYEDYDPKAEFDEYYVKSKSKTVENLENSVLQENDALILNMLFLANNKTSYLEFLKTYLQSAGSIAKSDRYVSAWESGPVDLIESDKSITVTRGYYGNVIGETFGQIMKRSAKHYLSKRIAGNYIDTATGMLSENNSIAILHMFKEGKDYDCMRTAIWPEGVATSRSMTGPVYCSSHCETLYTIAAIEAEPEPAKVALMTNIRDYGGAYDPLDLRLQ